jgi:hypothetical protein
MTQPAGKKWVVLLVHGVGPSEPREMLDAVAPAVAKVNSGLVLSDRYEMTREKDDGLGEEEYPVFVRRGRAADEEVVFAEVYWADLSMIREGGLDLLIGGVTLLFGVRHVADQAADQRGAPAGALRVLLHAASWLLRGPFFALYLFLACAALLAESAAWLYVPVSPAGAAVALGLLGLAFLGLGGFRAFRVRSSERWSMTPWLALAGVGLLAVALAVFAAAQPQGPAMDWLLGQVQHEYTHVRVVGGVDFYLATLLWAVERMFAVIAATMLVALAALLLARFTAPARFRPAFDVAYLAIAVQASLAVLVAAPVDLLTLHALSLGYSPSELHLLDNLYQFIGFKLLLVLALGGAGFYVWGRRARWAHNHPPQDWRRDNPTPRLIVSRIFEAVLVINAAVLFVFTLCVALMPHIDWPDWFPGRYIFLAAVLVVVLSLALRPTQFKVVLHIVKDVADHLHRAGRSFPVRRVIAGRFHRVLDRMFAQERPTHLVVLAHSQGSVIAINGLSQPGEAARLQTLQAVHLLTFGSPYTHLYQYYFPYQYPDDALDLLQKNVRDKGQWRNVFRTDDYVGTFIAGPDGWPADIPVAPGGLQAHTNYWQPDAMREVADLLPGHVPAGQGA